MYSLFINVLAGKTFKIYFANGYCSDDSVKWWSYFKLEGWTSANDCSMPFPKNVKNHFIIWKET